MEIHFTPRDVLYLAGTCNACGAEHDKQSELNRSSILESGDCGLCGKMYCAECEYECDCCHKMVCEGCTKPCVSCHTHTCFKCLNYQQLCTFCSTANEEQLSALVASHSREYGLINRGAWYLFGAGALGCVLVILWLLAGGKYE